MNMSFPSIRHVASLLLITKHLGSLRNTFYLRILSPWRSPSPLEEVILSLSLMWSLSPPLTSISKKGLLEFVVNGFGPWVTTQSNVKNVMLVEDKIHWVELDQKKHRISGKLFFLLWNRWHRVVCFSCTERIRLDQKHQIGETEFIAEKTLVTSAH